MAKKFKVDLNVAFKSLDGADTEVKIGQSVANMIAFNSKEDDALKAYGWAETLYAGAPLELDESDLKKFKTVVDGVKEHMTVSLRAQIARIIAAAEQSPEEVA